MDEEQKAAEALGELLTACMVRARDEHPTSRRWVYGWERLGLQWLLRYRDRTRGKSVGNPWMDSFLDLNAEAIIDEKGLMRFEQQTDHHL